MSGLLLACGLLICAMEAPGIIGGPSQLEHQNGRATTGSEQDHRSVLVELITSDQCGDCEAAEHTLAHLDHDQPVPNTDIIVFSERLDPSTPEGYLSPTDPTRRQEDYQEFGRSTQPSPIFLVNGIVQPAHISDAELEHAIASAPADVAPLRLTSVQVHGHGGSFVLANAPPTPGYVNVYTALVRRTVTADSQGATPQIRPGVIEAFGRIGSSFRTKALGEKPLEFQPYDGKDGASLSEMTLIVFIQTKHKGAVLGVTSCSLRKEQVSSGKFSDVLCPGLTD